MTSLSPRLAAIADALPLRPGLRVLEVGGAPGAAAREVARRVGAAGHVLVVDRSAEGIALVERAAAAEIAAGRLGVRCVAVEDLALAPGEAPYDLALAVRVGVLDGRHPAREAQALRRIADALTPGGRLFLDGGSPLREVDLGPYRPR
ncbi:methyltransferase domain-containing protein [Patulibacter brassicae]|uniref:Methyltransferase domain-containing protein n=1 Tax=Patulibacter brassicae TaxID=1705717 RepID=A0ABU4VM61_9ACTN|nr:methyltransferase domain-containing protein [Patulibacter brassicae]MDX8152759.1 methyltransferase domain-containing protein [Patulibacter brassicae]